MLIKYYGNVQYTPHGDSRHIIEDRLGGMGGYKKLRIYRNKIYGL